MSVNLGRVANYLKRNGIKKTAQLAYERSHANYDSNYVFEQPNQKVLRYQCAHSVLDEGPRKFDKKPIVSIVVPAYETNVEYMQV